MIHPSEPGLVRGQGSEQVPLHIALTLEAGQPGSQWRRQRRARRVQVGVASGGQDHASLPHGAERD